MWLYIVLQYSYVTRKKCFLDGLILKADIPIQQSVSGGAYFFVFFCTIVANTVDGICEFLWMKMVRKSDEGQKIWVVIEKHAF